MNKQEYILELIHKGHSDEEIELLVKDKFPEEEIIPFMPDINPASPTIPTIKAGWYTSNSYATGAIKFDSPIGNDLQSFFGIVGKPNSIIVEIKTSGTLHVSVTKTVLFRTTDFPENTSISVLTGNTDISLQAGHSYKFENFQDPVDLGITPPPSAGLTPQEAFDQTWDAVKKVNENIGYTNLVGKTGADLFTPLTIGKGYIVPLNPSLNGAEKFSGLVTAKGSTDCWLVGIGIDGRGNAYNLMVKVHNDGTITAGKTQGQSQADYNGFVPTVVGTPMNDKDATTKKYVDDKVPNGLKGSTITFEDGTTLVL